MPEILVSFEDKKTAIAQWVESLSGVPFNNIRGADQTGKFSYPAVVLAIISEIDTHRPFRKIEEIDGQLKYVVYASRQVMIDFNFITRSRGDYTEDPTDRYLDAQYYMSKFHGGLYMPEASIEFLGSNGMSLLSAASPLRADEKKDDGWQRRQVVEIGLGYVMQTAESVQTIESIQGIKGSIYNFDDKFEVEINLGPYQPTSEKGQPGGYASLDLEGKVPAEQLSDSIKIKVFAAISEAEQLTLTVQEGDICVRIDENKSYVALNADNASLADWQELLAAPQAAFISQDALNRLVTDAQIASWNAKQAGLGFTPEDIADKGIANGYASLGADGKIPDTQVPQIAITSTYVVADETEQLALTVQQGDVAVRTDENNSYIALNENNISMSDWQHLLTPTGAVASVDGQVGVVILSSSYINFNDAQTISGTKTFNDIKVNNISSPPDSDITIIPAGTGNLGNTTDLTDHKVRFTAILDSLFLGPQQALDLAHWPNIDKWQSFIAEKNGFLSVASFQKQYADSTVGTFYIRTGEGIGGSVLATQPATTTAAGWFNVTFANPAYVVKGNQYTLHYNDPQERNFEHAYGDLYSFGRSDVSAASDRTFRIYTKEVSEININKITGNVGIGKKLADERLDVEGNIKAESIIVTQDIYSVPWTDYSGLSTINGWVAPTASIRYKKVGDLVFVIFRITGTSNSGAANFTLPYFSVNVANVFPRSSISVDDNSVSRTAPGMVSIGINTNIVNLWTTFAADGWTTIGTKSAIGKLWYESQ